MTWDEIVVLGFIGLGIIPLALFLYFYLTRPVTGSKWRRRYSRVWQTTPIGPVLVFQKTAMLALLTYILIVRFTDGFPGREIVAVILYGLLQLGFWMVFGVLRHTQLHPPDDAPPPETTAPRVPRSPRNRR